VNRFGPVSLENFTKCLMNYQRWCHREIAGLFSDRAVGETVHMDRLLRYTAGASINDIATAHVGRGRRLAQIREVRCVGSGGKEFLAGCEEYTSRSRRATIQLQWNVRRKN